ncbi:extensin family protein [Sinorhizobium sp. RAC02]|uniref:extensin-like domain-containing protein n=1 Tax=Sinorhizobium sp. RAC02 TaxID=1842534 RepID=UPI000855EC2E|nr:extensin family protein [Sinorhizobium sp. RAC02]AOF91529.1 extensin-like family protein [Sinorhizobium sp. RAC02]
MSIAFVSRLRRPLGLFLVPVLLAACSGGLTPPDDIDGAGVGAIRPATDVSRRQTDDMGDTGGDLTAYPVEEPAGRVATADTAMMTPVTENKRLPMIDSDEAMGISQPVQASSGVLTVPEGGVNMDEGLGVERVEGLAETQANEIAEGNATQVVVDGIGTDTPQQIGQPDTIPMTEAGTELGTAADGDDYLQVPDKATTRRHKVVEEDQVAFLPRLNNPMQIPETMGGMPASEKACRQRLQKLGVKFRDVPRISKGRSCGIAWPVELSGLSGGIQIKPAAQVNCQITEAFARWVKQELVPSTRTRYLSGVSAIHQMSSYSCRTMNSQRGASMSEHAKGNAIDVGKIVLKSGKAIAIEKKGFFAFREKGLLKSVRSDSCKYFSTVLGPGSDRYHKDHFHFDLRARNSGYRHCSL